MPVRVRLIEPDDLTAWVDAVRVGFQQGPVPPGAAAARLGWMDLSRTFGAEDDGRFVATFRSFASELTLPGGATVPVSAITAVSVSPTHRRQGLMSGLMRADLQASAERGEAAAILIASEYPIYGRFGFGPAVDHATYRIGPRPVAFTAPPPPGSIRLVEPAALRPLAPELYEEHRRAVPGSITRDGAWWDRALGLVDVPGMPGWSGRAVVASDPAGRPTGYLRYHVDERWEHRVAVGTLVVDELVATTPEAYRLLWAMCLEADLVAEVEARDRSVDEPLRHLLVDARRFRQVHRSDLLWVRLLDPSAFLGARTYPVEVRVVLEVVDDLGLAGGRFALEGGPEGVSCTPSTASPALRLPVAALGAASLGGTSLASLAAAGLVEELVPGALAAADAAFGSPTTPWCTTWF